MRAKLLALALLASLASGLSAQTATAPLLERSKFFGNPSRSRGFISPDGKWLSWLAPRDGVLNIWVAPTAEPAKARPVSAEKDRPIRSYHWTPDSSKILFLNDRGGDENFVLYGVVVATGVQTLLTPFTGVAVDIVKISHQVPDRVLIVANNRDPKWHDVHSLDLRTGKLKLVFRNDRYASFIADDSLRLRVAAKTRSDGGTDFYWFRGGTVEPQPFAQATLADALTTLPLNFSADGRTLYWLDSRTSDTAALIAQDTISGASKVLASNEKSDVESIMTDPRTGRAQAFATNYLRKKWVPLAESVKTDLEYLRAHLKGDINVTSQTRNNDRWIVTADSASGPLATYLYTRPKRELMKLFVARPELQGVPLAAMLPLELKARDGLTLPSYLSLPPGSDSNGDQKPDHPLPMVLLVHGGPWSRNVYGFNATHQWLANRGYAVLSVNFRGSTGFGKRFISAADLEWGRKMQHDLIDASRWAVANGVALNDKIAIMGTSYGGYATLVGLTATPDQFACGVDIVGPSNLFTVLETIPPYWEYFRRQWYERMGDPTTADGRALLKERSPIFRIDAIRRPLLIGQGKNDPRVNVRESEQIVRAMQAKNIPVTYVLFPDEGHGFARPVNSIAFNAIVENFLKPCLGGRAEPIGQALKQSTAQVPHGAEFILGLQAALSPR